MGASDEGFGIGVGIKCSTLKISCYNKICNCYHMHVSTSIWNSFTRCATLHVCLFELNDVSVYFASSRLMLSLSEFTRTVNRDSVSCEKKRHVFGLLRNEENEKQNIGI